MSTPPNARPEVSRRAMLRTTAWSFPVVSLTAAAPAFAGSTTAGGTLALDNTPIRPAWSGTRNPATLGSGWFRIQNLAITNNGPDALPNGALQITITFPQAWGTITGYSENRPWPVGYTWTTTGNVLTILAGPEVGGIAANGVLNVADIVGGDGGDDLWFDTTNGSGGLGLNNMTVTVGTYDTNVTTDFAGASRAASVVTLGVSRVWTTIS